MRLLRNLLFVHSGEVPLLPSALATSLALLACPAALTAQPITGGTLCGTIRDPAGRPLAGVRIEVTSTALYGQRTLASDANGEWTCPCLPEGTYTVVAHLNGFLSVKATVALKLKHVMRQDLVLKPIQMACATVEVVAAAAAVDCTRTMRTTSLAPGVTSGGVPASVRHRSAAWNTESYNAIQENPFRSSRKEPLSTFSIDVDTASYSNLRRYLTQGSVPPKDAVRIEELLNYFTYDDPEPGSQHPFSVNTEVFPCPWAPEHKLLRIALQGQRLKLDQLPPRNLVFLVDVSGSMSDENKLPLVKQGLSALCESLRPQDHVAIVVYAGSSGLVLEPTSGAHKEGIQAALSRLEAGGSTHGVQGIQQAYEVAKAHFQKGADNRVILCTDGDFNVGVSDQGSLVHLIETQRQSGVFLTCLGFGMGNLKDGTLEQLANKGNGNYAYIDSLKEMRKVFGAGGASLVTIAKDVKLQLEFNPAMVQGYRLIGYENRILDAADFNNDAKDAGEMNAGHSVTALYELVPTGVRMDASSVDDLKYQTESRLLKKAPPELLTVKLRYKKPDAFFSQRLEVAVKEQLDSIEQASPDSRWAAAVAAFGLVLRDSPHKGSSTLALARSLAGGALGKDPGGYRNEFLALMGTCARILPRARTGQP